MMYGYGPHDMGGWAWAGMILMVVLGVLVVALLLASVLGAGSRFPATPRGGEARDDRALAILRERYARGEISAEEYRQARETLEGTRN